MRFPTGESLHMFQQFTGLNAWDQIAVHVSINGNLPRNIPARTFTTPSFVEEFKFIEETALQSQAERVITLPDGQTLMYNLNQEIRFEKSALCEGESNLNAAPLFLSVSKIQSDFHSNEGALRIGLLSAVNLDGIKDPCNSGSGFCGQNAVCIVDENENPTVGSD